MTSLPEKIISLDQMMPLILEQIAQGHSVRLHPKGTSMRPMLRQGIDSVELSPVSGRLKKYDLPLYQRDNGQYVLHRILKVGDTYTCIGDNQFDYEPGVRQDQLLAVVAGFYRGEKYHSVNSISYKCYCRFWHYTRRIRGYWRAFKYRIQKTGT